MAEAVAGLELHIIKIKIFFFFPAQITRLLRPSLLLPHRRPSLPYACPHTCLWPQVGECGQAWKEAHAYWAPSCLPAVPSPHPCLLAVPLPTLRSLVPDFDHLRQYASNDRSNSFRWRPSKQVNPQLIVSDSHGATLGHPVLRDVFQI